MGYIDITIFLLIVVPCVIFFTFYNSAKLKKWLDILYTNIKPWLRKNISISFVSFLVHGGFHSLMFIIISMCILVLWTGSRSQQGPEPKSISLTLTRASSIDSLCQSPITDYNIQFIMNSDSLYKESGYRGRSGIKISYEADNDSVDYGKLYLTWKKKGQSYAYRNNPKFINCPPIETKYNTDSLAVFDFMPPLYSFMPGFDKYGYNEISIVNDEALGNGDNPYYYYHLYVDLVDANVIYREAFLTNSDFHIEISFQVGDIKLQDSIEIDGRTIQPPLGQWSNKNLRYTYIWPIPDEISNGSIKYKSKASIEKILNGRFIVIQAEDIDLIQKNSKDSLILTILLGMLVGFLLDVIIQLIKDLRSFNQKKNEKNTKNAKIQDAQSLEDNSSLNLTEDNNNEVIEEDEITTGCSSDNISEDVHTSSSDPRILINVPSDSAKTEDYKETEETITNVVDESLNEEDVTD